ncbi:DUF2939 domain-containing protein [Asticcacaulis sp. EMRT-3]|uniref:DUF2939 domain-containing protein n=1 Tax=Asticcacaulis sp. EMRT-3 TaxID=3040349 RepID=UPI0024AF45D3|nr:DUF2939 domain-containing protein [Asticcacaulis sp. EMRT-3]MDI7775100.1 DUF2939 domain-containing protein [Asticcacaulis sp. EMRT-3]
MSRLLSFLLVVIVAGAAALFYFAPTLAFYDIRSACKSQDIGSLAELVDFDAVRTSLRIQLEAGRQGVAAPAPDALNDPVGATGSALKNVADSVGRAFSDLVHPETAKPAPPPIDPNAYLTPRALLGLTYGQAEDADRFDPAGYEAKPPRPHVVFFSLEHVRLTVSDEIHGTTTFTFERHGLTHWRLVHIGLPLPGTDSETSGSPAG